MISRPDDLGVSGERLAHLTALTHGYVDDGRLPCCLTQISRHGQVVYRDAYGWADIEEGRRLADDAIFRIYSMTKPIASVALMMLYEEGAVLLENRVSRYIPELAGLRVWKDGTEDGYETVEADREVTVHDVLTHLAGFTTGFQQEHPLDALYRRRALGELGKPAPDYDLAGCMERLAELPLLSQPGTRFCYGMSTDVVARLVEVISGQRFDDFLRERIFEPLAMDDTGFHASDGDRLVSMYGRDRAKQLRRIARGPGSSATRPPAFLSGAGGLLSTVGDYQRFCDALLGGGEAHGVRLVGPKTLAAMTANQLPGGRTLNEVGQSTFSEAAMGGTGFGLGFEVTVDPAATMASGSGGEFGWGGAASTYFWVDPVERLTVIFLTQLLPSNTYPVRRQLRAVVNQAIVESYDERPRSPARGPSGREITRM